MTKKENVDWQKIYYYIDLLEYFTKLRDSEEPQTTIKEDPKRYESAIDFLVKKKAMRIGDIYDKLHRFCMVKDLKIKLGALNLKVSGNKQVLIDRLIKHDRNNLEKQYEDKSVYQTTNFGKKVVANYLQEYNVKKREASKQTYACLLEENVERAKKSSMNSLKNGRTDAPNSHKSSIEYLKPT